jgi:hypothetical protein
MICLTKGHKVVIQQRLHESDLTGDLLQRGGHAHLCLPAEFEPDRRYGTSIGWQDPRTEAGALLCPQRFSQTALEEYQTALGSYRYAGQFQQRPAPADGGMLKRHWWGYWQPRGVNLPPVTVKLPNGTIELRKAVELPIRFGSQIQSWDMAFKNTAFQPSPAARQQHDNLSELPRAHCPDPQQRLRALPSEAVDCQNLSRSDHTVVGLFAQPQRTDAGVRHQQLTIVAC